ncbi:unnamed protein product [Nyctereutes procyonoides]|uniref:(raccoon dog) hypothetical protein n=1 Tax=Nyctereutes procyonoides TaxID=34880 RepID=A0A811ZX99_NYCPR|nr:unnamed protein product [Nyctereutes procyonoides]
MCLGFFSPVPSSTSSATGRQGSASWPSSDPRAEISLLEINQELQSKLEKSQQDFRDLKEKFLMSEATAYSQANQLQKYRCKELTDIIESVLGEKLQLEEGKRTEVLAEKLRQCHILIKDHAKELTRLYQKLREGTDISERLNEHLEDLLTHDDPEHSRGQGFQEQLTEGGRLAKRLARKPSAENYDDEEDEEKQETLTPSLEQQEVEKKGILQDPPDECVLTPSILQDRSESHQASGDGEFSSDEQEFDSAVDLPCECSQSKGAETPRGPPENQKDLGKGNGHHPMSPSLEQQEVEKKEVLQDPPDECVLTPSILQDGSESHQASEFDSAVDLPCECCQSKGAETPRGPPDPGLNPTSGSRCMEPASPSACVSPPCRLGRLQLEVVEQNIPWDSLDEGYLTYSRSATIFSPEELEVCFPLEVAKNPIHHEEEGDQDLICPRLSRELPEVKEQDVPRDPLDECYLTYSALPDLSDSHKTSLRANMNSFEDVDICSALEVARNHNDCWEEEDQGQICPQVTLKNHGL